LLAVVGGYREIVVLHSRKFTERALECVQAPEQRSHAGR